MLNSPEWKIFQIYHPIHSSTCPFAAKVSFHNRKNGKKTEALFEGEQNWLQIANQCREQLSLREYVTIAPEPAPKKVSAPVVPSPVKKGKKKG